MKLNWKTLVSEDNKNISQGRFWTNILLILSCVQWFRGYDIPTGLGSLIAALLLYNFGKKLKFTKDGFVKDDSSILITEPNQIDKKTREA